MRTPQRGAKDRPPRRGAPIPARVLRAKEDRHRQRKPSWNAPRRGQS